MGFLGNFFGGSPPKPEVPKMSSSANDSSEEAVHQEVEPPPPMEQSVGDEAKPMPADQESMMVDSEGETPSPTPDSNTAEDDPAE